MIPIPGFKDYFVVGNDIVSMRRGKYKVLKGSLDTKGHLQVDLKDFKGKRKLKLIHRLLAQAYLPDYSEDLQVDHIDRCKTNNDISNLRMVTNAENMQNTNAKGCYLDKRTGIWYAKIMVDGKQIHIGSYDTQADARAAYLAKKAELHPFYVP
jgi:hypothetical protein